MRLTSPFPASSPTGTRLIGVTAAAWATIAFVCGIAIGINGIS